MKDINQIIRERRSIFPKEFNGQRVDDEVVNQLLENAHWAPSHGLSLAWRFMVYTDGAKDQLFEYWKSIAPEEKQDKLELNKTKTSHVLIIVAKHNGKNPLEEEKASVACAIQNIYLSLSQYPNVGGYWGSGNGTYTKEFAHFLGLADDEHCMGYFMLGKVDQKRTKAGRPSYNAQVIWKKE